MSPSPGLTLAEFAAKYACSEATVRRYIRQRRLGCLKVFRNCWITPEHERKFLEAHDQKAVRIWQPGRAAA